jgi:tRNA (guanine-N7-)-methyltransferase
MGKDRSRGSVEAGVLISRDGANPESTETPDASRRRRHFGRRKGWKLRPHQAGLLDTLLPRLSFAPEKGRDPKTYFPGLSPKEIWLEIGFGGGEHLAWQAQAHPDVGILGAEPFVAGMAKLPSKIDDSGFSNIRLYTEDARDIIDALPIASLARVFLLFPDPWPKMRHRKRRFIQTDMLDALARIMMQGAEFRLATDDPHYLDWALERLMAHPHFTWTAESASDWRTRPADCPPTRYEAKALHGVPVFLRFVRV